MKLGVCKRRDIPPSQAAVPRVFPFGRATEHHHASVNQSPSISETQVLGQALESVATNLPLNSNYVSM